MVFPERFIAGISKQANHMDVYDRNNFANATNHAEGKLCHNRVPTDMILVSNKNILQKNSRIVYFFDCESVLNIILFTLQSFKIK